MATYLLIGPSGAGKSSASEIIIQKSDIQIFDLDVVLKKKIGGGSLSAYLRDNGDQLFFSLSKETIEEIENNSICDQIVVVGAGSINLHTSHEWFKQKYLISLTGDPQILYDRGNRKMHHPSFDSYLKTEFNKNRTDLYSTANICIDVTSKSCNETAEAIIQAVKNYR